MPKSQPASPAPKHRARRSGRQAAYRFSRFSPEYRARLLRGLCDLQDFCRKFACASLRQLLKHPKLADHEFSKYVMMKYEDGRNSTRSTVKHALLGCQHLAPRLKGQLVTAWENMRVWEEQRKTRPRPPLPVPIWAFMTGLSRAHAKVAAGAKFQREWCVFALMLELGLLCLLRPGELFKLRWNDFALPGSFSMSQSHAALRIISPKNRRQFGDEQFVILQNPNTIEWIRTLSQGFASELVWQGTPHRFSKLFKEITMELGVADCKFTPGSLRPGGATMLFGRGISISTLRFLGRWTVEKSLEHYVQQAMAVQILNRLDECTVARLCKLGPKCLDHILLLECSQRLASL